MQLLVVFGSPKNEPLQGPNVPEALWVPALLGRDWLRRRSRLCLS